MPDCRVSALDFAASGTQQELEIVTIAYARVLDYLHRCAWDVFLIESQAAKCPGGMQQIIESVGGCHVVRLHTYQFASTQNEGGFRVDFNLQCLRSVP